VRIDRDASLVLRALELHLARDEREQRVVVAHADANAGMELGAARTMMWPGLTTSPPYFFTPRRFEFESRPFRVEPCPFLCAIYLPATTSVMRTCVCGCRCPQRLRSFFFAL